MTLRFISAIHHMAIIPTIVSATGLALAPVSDGSREAGSAKPFLRWDPGSRVRIASGTYGRIIRLGPRRLLCGYEAGGKSWTRASRDNGRSWEAPAPARELPDAAAANPELLRLKSGRVLLFYNQRPRDGKSPFAIGCCASDDGGKSWRPAREWIFTAGIRPAEGCWEPAAIQLPSGEIQLFFANEQPYPETDDQEITLMRSLDEGRTWSAPETVSHRPGHRDGMPVPLLLRGGKGIALAIEDNGLAPGYALQPAIVHTTMAANWRGPVEKGDGPRRWGALDPPLPAGVYAGAPYLAQFATGETVLSCQSREGERRRPRMVVYVGDSSARRFRNPTVPFDVPDGASGLWCSLFVKDRRTVTAVADTVVDGVRGLWAIDGRLIR